MINNYTPNLCRDAVCISNDVRNSAIISSYFNKPRQYFAVFSSPRELDIVRRREVVFVNNIIAKINPKWILLSNLDEKVRDDFLKKFPSERVIIIDFEEEIKEKLKNVITQPTNNVFCRENDIAKGLLFAKNQNAKLIIDNSAKDINKFTTNRHLVFLDDFSGVVPTITANYAYSIGASIAIGKEYKREIVEDICESFLVSRIYRGHERGLIAEKKIKDTANLLDIQSILSNFDFITFITNGIPYGYFAPYLPCTHIFSLSNIGVTLAESMFYAKYINYIRSVLVIDPGFFKNSETNYVLQPFRNSGSYVRSLIGKNATVYQTRMHIQYFPYDLLFICTHAGKVSGKRYKIQIEDQDGKSHIVVIDMVFEYTKPPGEITDDTKLEVIDQRIFIEFDGKEWNKSNQKDFNWAEGSFFKTFMNTTPSQWNVIDQYDISYVKNSFRIECIDGFCVFALQELADLENPFIFNNSCSSFHSIAAQCLYAGAISYIGTIFPVKDNDAKIIAKKVFSNTNDSTPLAFKIWEAQNFVYKNTADRPYINIGCHFLAINTSEKNIKKSLPKRISISLKNRKRMLEMQNCSKEEKDHIESVINFLEFLTL